VRGDVAKAVDLPPPDLAMPILEPRAESGGRVREDLEPPQDRVLDQSMLEEHRTPVADVVVDQLDALSDVFDSSRVMDDILPDPTTEETVDG
jgi:hypothetical protein